MVNSQEIIAKRCNILRPMLILMMFCVMSLLSLAWLLSHFFLSSWILYDADKAVKI